MSEKCRACIIVEELKEKGVTKVYDRYYCTCNGKDRKWRFNILTVVLNILVPLSWLGFVVSTFGFIFALGWEGNGWEATDIEGIIIGGMFGGGIIISLICIILVKLSANLFPDSNYICYERPVREDKYSSSYNDGFAMTDNPEVTEEWKQLKSLCGNTPFDY